MTNDLCVLAILCPVLCHPCPDPNHHHTAGVVAADIVIMMIAWRVDYVTDCNSR